MYIGLEMAEMRDAKTNRINKKELVEVRGRQLESDGVQPLRQDSEAALLDSYMQALSDKALKEAI